MVAIRGVERSRPGSLAKGNGNVESQVISGTGMLKESRESQDHKAGHGAFGGWISRLAVISLRCDRAVEVGARSGEWVLWSARLEESGAPAREPGSSAGARGAQREREAGGGGNAPGQASTAGLLESCGWRCLLAKQAW